MPKLTARRVPKRDREATWGERACGIAEVEGARKVLVSSRMNTRLSALPLLRGRVNTLCIYCEMRCRLGRQ